jgi:MFS family permease
MGRDFRCLWIAQAISKLGSHIGYAGLSFAAILLLDATPAQMGMLTALETAPVLVVGLFAGVWVDRSRRRLLMIVADVGRAVLLATVVVAALAGLLGLTHIYVVAALTGILTLFFDLADRSFLPRVVPRDQLVEANSRLAASESVAEMGGPALGGALVQWLTVPFAILLDSLSFLASALFLGAIRVTEPARARPDDGNEQGVWEEFGAGFRVVWRDPRLRTLGLCDAANSFFGNFIGTLYGLYLIREHGLTPALVGVAVSVGGVAALLGALIAGPVTRRFGLGRTLVGTRLIDGAVGFLLPLAAGPKLVVIAMIMGSQFLGDIPGAIHRINEASVRQTLIPHELLGRANAAMDLLARGLAPLGALAGGVLGELIGMRATLFVAFTGIVVADLVLLASPLRKLRCGR